MNKGFFDLEDTITRGDEVIKNNVKKVQMSQNEIDTYNSYAEKVITTTDVKKAIHMIHIISKSDMIAFDYETTGKKPFRKGHRIFSASISDGENTFSFPFFNDEDFLSAWKELMLGPIQKICHNAKFESVWSKVILGYYPKNIIADTMINAHIINNRNKVGLKPLTKQYFNVYGYEDSISNFLSVDPIEEKKYGANAFNRIDKAPIDKLLLYGGLDSLFTYLLYEKQLEELDEHTSIGAKFFTSATLDLAKVEVEGFPFNIKQAKQAFTEIEHKMKTIESDTMNMKEMKLWGKNIPFRFTAAGDLSYLLFDKMKYKLNEKNKTVTGKAKMDVDTLEKYKLPLVKNVLEWRKWKKIKDTYIASLTRECIDNKIHASIRLENVPTYRSSCSDPNLQNQPARDEVAMNLVRKCFIPNSGCKLGEYDYRALEACLDGNTLIETISGKMKLKDIVSNYKEKDIYVYCYNNEKERIGVSKVINGKKTGIDKEVLKIVLDNDKYIIATPNHKFMLRDGTYKEAKDLIIGQSMMPFYSKIKHSKETGVNYKQIELNNGKKMMGHNLIALDLFDTIITGSGKCVHHKDHNGMNNSLDNIKIISRKKHMRIHAVESWTKPKKKRNFDKNRSPELIKLRTEGWHKWFNSLTEDQKNDQYKRMMETRGGMSGKNNPMYGKKHTKESIEKNILSHIGQPGRKWTEEQKKASSKKMKGRIMTWGDKVSATKKAQHKHLTDEHKQKLSIAGKGKIHSKKIRQLQSELKKQWWANKKLHNHKIVKIIKVKNRDVYNITVEGTHNFATEAGIIVKNCVIAIYNKDPKWIEYVSNIDNDMHRDMAAKIFIKDKKDVTKNDRFLGKNGFVFPTVYGSYWKNTALNLWDCEKETKEHLKDEGIRNLNDFREHIHEVEDWFWFDQFPVGYEWMNKTIADYEKNGYIDLYTGFRCYSPMSKNQVINYRVQGTASHCKLWTLQHVQHDLLKKKMKSRILLEVHDSIIPNIYIEEEEYLDYIIWNYGTQKIREYWNFLIVPLYVEKKISEVNGNWASMEVKGLLSGK